MQSSSFSAGTSPYPGPYLQAAVPSIIVQSTPEPLGTPQFPVPQIPHSATQSIATSGVSTQVTGSPTFPVPQRHSTTPTQPTFSPSLHPLRTFQSAPGSGSRTSVSSLSRGSPLPNAKPLLAPAVESLRGALHYPEGEIPVLEKDDQCWATLAHSGLLATQKRKHLPWWNLCGSKNSWIDAEGVLLGNQILLLGKETVGTTKLSHIIRPIPLECLRLASFNDEPEVRQVQQPKPGFFRQISSCCSSSTPEPLYPFTIYHAAAKITRRYTLYTQTATERNRWRTALDDAIEARKSKQEKMLYATQTLNDGGFFRIAPRIQFTRGVHYTGRTVCAAGFSFQQEGYIAVGCTTGVYVSKRAAEYSFQKVLEYNEPMSIVAIPEFDKFLVHCEMSLFSYPLEMIVRASRGEATAKDLEDSMKRLAEEHGTILFLKTGNVTGRILVIYASNLSGQPSTHILELSHQVGILDNPAEYQPLSSVPIPEDPHDAVFFLDKVAICASNAIYILEPLLNPTNPTFKVAPDLPNTKRDPKTLQFVPKIKGDAPKILDLMGKANVLGMVTYQNDILLIYEDFGCFVDLVGKPARTSYYIEWERRANGYARRDSHLLLLSSIYIEVRSIDTGKLVQIVDVNDMRLLRSGLTEPGMLVAAMIGGTEDDGGRTERLAELVYQAIDAQK